MKRESEIRECGSIDDLAACVSLQREVFALPDIEISPVRHFIVTANAGGFTLGAFVKKRLIGFVLTVPAFLRGEPAFYSHMMAVSKDFQSMGIGAELKWAQREASLARGVAFIKWTFEPPKAKNAYFNLEKLGAIATEYKRNFYGTDYSTSPGIGTTIGLASDRLFAEWHLRSDRVNLLANGKRQAIDFDPEARISVPEDWIGMIGDDPTAALSEQMRIRSEFEACFARGLIGRGFERPAGKPPSYLMHKI